MIDFSLSSRGERCIAMGWGWKTSYGDKTHFVPYSDSTQSHTLCGLHTSLGWQGNPDENKWLPRCRKCEEIVRKLDEGADECSKWNRSEVF